MPTFHQQMFSLNTMTMNCSYYKRRLMHHMTISVTRTLMSMKSKIKMSSSFMPPTLATIFALPQFVAQHNCENLKTTDTPSTVPTALQGSSDHTFNPKCAYNLMATQCYQSQYLTLMKPICAHNPSASQVSQTNRSNSLASPYPPDPGEHVLKRSATGTGKEDFPVKWFKFIHPSPKPRMTETPVHKLVHVAYPLPP